MFRSPYRVPNIDFSTFLLLSPVLRITVFVKFSCLSPSPSLDTFYESSLSVSPISSGFLHTIHLWVSFKLLPLSLISSQSTRVIKSIPSYYLFKKKEWGLKKKDNFRQLQKINKLKETTKRGRGTLQLTK